MSNSFFIHYFHTLVNFIISSNSDGGRGGFSNFDFSGAFSDIFGSDIFDDIFEGFGGMGGRRQRRSYDFRGADLRFDLPISLEDAYNGTKQEINFSFF